MSGKSDKQTNFEVQWLHIGATVRIVGLTAILYFKYRALQTSGGGLRYYFERPKFKLRRLTSCAGMTCHVESIWPKIAIFPQFQVYLIITQAKQTISLLLLSHFYPVVRIRIRKRRRIVVYGFGHSLRSANQLLAQEIKVTHEETLGQRQMRESDRPEREIQSAGVF